VSGELAEVREVSAGLRAANARLRELLAERALCTIRGGSARKHAIYRKASGDWYYDESYPSVEAAWEAVRGAFVEASVSWSRATQ
jgi:hypothetical protein